MSGRNYSTEEGKHPVDDLILACACQNGVCEIGRERERIGKGDK